jgi:uncharacterized protein
MVQTADCEVAGGLSAIQQPGPWLWSQSWRDLLFCHWQVPGSVLQRLLPAGLEVDTWDGSGWVSAVAFRLTVRRRWLPPVPLVSSVLELNLRTYVLYHGEPAIYFLSIHAGKRSVVRLARWFTPLPYRFASIHYARRPERFDFHSHEPANSPDRTFSVRFVPEGREREALPGTFDSWLLERYRLHATDKDRSLLATVVQHPPWRFHDVTVSISENTLGRAFDIDLSPPPQRCHFATGVRALVWPFARLCCGADFAV